MITAAQIELVKQTVPVLQQHGETLAHHLYARMFEYNPEVKPYFNPAHQRSGSQQRALAGAILAYAQHIDNPSALNEAIEVIAQKHVSLTIQPEHYPIVGENLLASIKEVLGKAATNEIIDAWAAAYDELAKVFIAREQVIYDQQRKHQGWTGFKSFTIVKCQPESENITSWYLAPVDGEPLPRHQPGQYVSVRLRDGEDNTVMRNYSLSNAPGEAAYRISVKREDGINGNPDGDVSHRIHGTLGIGSQIELTPPCGNFRLELPTAEAQPLVFIAGGVGVTPLISMAHAALEACASRPIIFIQCARHAGVRAFAAELEALAREYANFTLHVRLDEPETQNNADVKRKEITAGEMESWTGERNATYYFCGPLPMMRQIDQLLEASGIPDHERRYECFGPLQPLAA